MHWLLALLAPLWLAPLPPGVPARLLELEGRVLLATDRGLYAQGDPGWRVVVREPATDVVADPTEDGAWFAAAGGALYRGRGVSDYQHVPLAPGAEVRAVAEHGGRIWVATEAGLFAQSGAAFERANSLPAGAVDSVRSSERGALWIGKGGGLWELAGGAFVPRVRGAREGWRELLGVVDLDDGALVAVPDGLWRVTPGEPPVRVELGAGEIRSIATEGVHLWIAAARGLLHLPLQGVDSVAPVLALGAEAFDVRRVGHEVLAATANGISRLGVKPEAVLPLRTRARSGPGPEVVRRAVLAYQGLGPRHIERVEARVRDAAWLPQVRLSGGLDRGRSSGRDSDQTFSTGAIHELFDRARGTDTGVGLDVQLTWELDRLAEPGDAIAVSRERRELIELRDQVLERVNRLYFERERALAQHAAAAPAEQPALQLRVQELTAALDAWSGGLFSRLDQELRLTPEGSGRRK